MNQETIDKVEEIMDCIIHPDIIDDTYTLATVLSKLSIWKNELEDKENAEQ